MPKTESKNGALHSGMDERFENLLGGIGDCESNDDELDALREICRALWAQVPAAGQAAFFADPDVVGVVKKADKWVAAANG